MTIGNLSGLNLFGLNSQTTTNAQSTPFIGLGPIFPGGQNWFLELIYLSLFAGLFPNITTPNSTKNADSYAIKRADGSLDYINGRNRSEGDLQHTFGTSDVPVGLYRLLTGSDANLLDIDQNGKISAVEELASSVAIDNMDGVLDGNITDQNIQAFNNLDKNEAKSKLITELVNITDSSATNLEPYGPQIPTEYPLGIVSTEFLTET